MRTSRTTLIILAVCSVVFVIGELFFVPKTYVNSVIVQALQAPRVFFSTFGNRYSLAGQLAEVQLENQRLRAELYALENNPALITTAKKTYVHAAVYSVYPLNNAGTILIAAGLEEGIREGFVVVAQPGVFVGEVTRVYAHQSEVRTLYDTGWELPVKIGSENIDSLLIGGNEPRLTLISKKKPAATSMKVYTAAKKYPYGLLLGSMGDPADSENNLFQEAPLTLPYLLGDLQKVYVLITP